MIKRAEVTLELEIGAERIRMSLDEYKKREYVTVKTSEEIRKILLKS